MRSFSALQRAEIAEIVLDDRQVHAASCFSALQRAEIAEIVRPVDTPGALLKVSVLFNEPKLLKSVIPRPRRGALKVSVLFSEPKIPQSCSGCNHHMRQPCFSALQRAENSSIVRRYACAAWVHAFQCSSASRKFLNPDPRTCVHPYFRPRRSRFVISEPSWCVAMTPVY